MNLEKIINIEEIDDLVPMLDIETDGDHLFFANDILVHNSALEADEIHQGHIQGGISKVNTVDNLIPIIQTEQMRAAGEYVLSFAKTRNSDGVGKSIILGWNSATLQVTSLNNVKNQLQLAKKQQELIMDTSGTVFDKEIKNGASLLGLMQT